MRRVFPSLSLIIAACLPAPVSAQGYPFSQRGTVSQMVAFTRLEIENVRPTTRGRALFGALVPWDSVWHPGADSATTLTVSQPVTCEGRQLPAGAYSLWLIPRNAAPWTLIVSRVTSIEHAVPRCCFRRAADRRCARLGDACRNADLRVSAGTS